MSGGLVGRVNLAVGRASVRVLSSIWAAYLFGALAVIGHPAWQSTPAVWVQWVSTTFLQLVALPLLAYGQAHTAARAADRHTELLDRHEKLLEHVRRPE